MGRKFVIDTGFQTVSAAQDLLEIPFPATCVCLIHKIELYQSSDATASEAEHLQVTLKKGIGNTSGSGGSTITPQRISSGDAVSGITVERNNTTQAVAGAGSLTTIENWIYDVLAAMEVIDVPEDRREYSPSEVLILAMTAPADPLTLGAKIVIELLGG